MGLFRRKSKLIFTPVQSDYIEVRDTVQHGDHHDLVVTRISRQYSNDLGLSCGHVLRLRRDASIPAAVPIPAIH